jgi:hypothetical protein
MAEDTLAKDIRWNSRLEEYFATTGEKAHCLSWLHKKSEEMYSFRTVFVDLPVIILGTLNGAVSVGSDSLFGGSQYASVCVGAVALLTAILSTIGSYFAWNRRAEGHRISALNYAKLYRFLSIEMALPRHERMTPSDLLKYVKTEYDRLSEISPLVPPTIINDFRQRFNRPEYETIAKPEDTNGLHPIAIYHDPSIISPSAFQVGVRPTVEEITLPSGRDVPAAVAITAAHSPLVAPTHGELSNVPPAAHSV